MNQVLQTQLAELAARIYHHDPVAPLELKDLGPLERDKWHDIAAAMCGSIKEYYIKMNEQFLRNL